MSTTKTIKFNRARRMFMGHSQGATTGPLFLAVAKQVRGAVLSAAGGHFLLNALTRLEPIYGGLTISDLIGLLLGTPPDLFHPLLHFMQMGSEPSDAVAYAPYLARRRARKPLSVLFTHGMLDGYVTTPCTTSIAGAGRYPLIAPTFPAMSFPALGPGYSYEETFDLGGLSILTPPVSGNIGTPKKRATGGVILFETDGHFPIFYNPDAIDQYREFLRSLAYDPTPTIPSR